MTNEKKIFIQPDWPAPANIKAYTTLRQSNVGMKAPVYETDVKKPSRIGDLNRALLKEILQLPDEPLWLLQTHSTIALKCAAENHGKEADASFTDEPNKVCAVLTADCLPVLLCHRDGTQVAAIHAGWRGLANGVIESTLKEMNISPQDTLAWMGPAIGPERFEVRKDVYDIFINHDSAAESAFTEFAENHWLANIYTLARQRLQNFGISEIYGGEHCTHSNEEDFFSYRRDGKIVGSIISLIWIADSNDKI
jgi:YfiH family protein